MTNEDVSAKVMLNKVDIAWRQAVAKRLPLDLLAAFDEAAEQTRRGFRAEFYPEIGKRVGIEYLRTKLSVSSLEGINSLSEPMATLVLEAFPPLLRSLEKAMSRHPMMTYYVPYQDKTFGHNPSRYDALLRFLYWRERNESQKATGVYDGASLLINSIGWPVITIIATNSRFNWNLDTGEMIWPLTNGPAVWRDVMFTPGEEDLIDMDQPAVAV